LFSKFQEIVNDDVVPIRGQDFCGSTRPAFEGAVDERSFQSVFIRRLKVMFVRGNHHDLVGLEIEQLRNEQINFRVRLVTLYVFR
jgi:hypothetical protein